MISSIASLVSDLPHKFLNNLRHRNIGKKETLGKSKFWVETYSSAQFSFQKVNLGSRSQKTCKSRYQTFLDLSSFTRFLHFVKKKLGSSILLKICLSKQIFGLN